MNVVMIALENANAVRVGDEVLLLADINRLRAHDMANLMESYNPREVTTRINPLLPRIVV